MKKKFLIIITIIFTLIVLGFWSPWNNISINWLSVFGFDTQDKQSGLKVLSHAGEIDVYIDDEYVGSTVDNTVFLEIPQIEPGEHMVKLIRSSETAEYAEIIRKLNFEPAVDVIIGYEIGPSEVFSEGHILYTQKSYSKLPNPMLEIFSTPSDIKVSLDGRYVGETPIKDISIDLGGKHLLKFEKEGYDTLEIEILPDTQEERSKLSDLKLVLEVNLFARPVEIVNK